MFSRVSGDPLSKLPVPHKLAVLATMDEVSVCTGLLRLVGIAVKVSWLNKSQHMAGVHMPHLIMQAINLNRLICGCRGQMTCPFPSRQLFLFFSFLPFLCIILSLSLFLSLSLSLSLSLLTSFSLF